MRLLLSALAIGSTVGAATAAAQTAQDYLGLCAETDSDCVSDRSQFTKDFPRAMRGNYQAQRNVAYFLGRSENGAVKVNKITACAWRMVIVASGSHEVDSGDTGNLKADCGKLDQVDRLAAQAQATSLIRKIYGQR